MVFEVTHFCHYCSFKTCMLILKVLNYGKSLLFEEEPNFWQKGLRSFGTKIDGQLVSGLKK